MATDGRDGTGTAGSSTPPRPLVVGLDHVQLAMPAGGEDRARAFYGRALGMREVDKPAGLAGRGGVWFESAGARVHLGVEEPFTPSRKAHPALVVRDLDEATRRLAAAGARTAPDAAIAGVRRAFATDPFGNRVELIADREGSLASDG